MKNETTHPEAPEKALPMCGVIMPMSAAPGDGLPKEHWEEVYKILESAISTAGLQARIVSIADETAIIQKSIVGNLYSDPVVVCDLSAAKPNVLFELGIRIAFDKPVVIVKDEKTPYNFDTQTIEHLDYPRDLRHGKIEDFKQKLAAKVRATFSRSQEGNYPTFLQSFGPFHVAKLEQKEVGATDLRLEQIQYQLSLIHRRLSDASGIAGAAPVAQPSLAFTLDAPSAKKEHIDELAQAVGAASAIQHRNGKWGFVLEYPLSMEQIVARLPKNLPQPCAFQVGLEFFHRSSGFPNLGPQDSTSAR